MKSFIADKKYLLFPIAMDAPCKTVAIWTKNEKIYEFDVPIGESGSPYRFQYYAPLIMCIQNSISRRFIFPRKPDG